MKKLLWALVPLVLAFIAIFVLSLTDFEGAKVSVLITLEILLISTALFTSALIGLVFWLRYRQQYKRKLLKKLYRDKSQDEHQRFIQRLDHELKNPLTAIQLGLENIKSVSDDPSINESISGTQVQTQRLNQLINDLRKITAFDSQELYLEEVDVAYLLEECESLAKDHSQAAERNIRLILPAAPWPVPNIYGDRDLLQLGLYNLVENAIKYSNRGDNVDIRATDDQHWVTIEIADTGLGINDDDIEHVWGELFRSPDTRDRAGSGIGLSLVKRIIERHNGELSLSSKQGFGTRVCVKLPVYTK